MYFLKDQYQNRRIGKPVDFTRGFHFPAVFNMPFEGKVEEIPFHNGVIGLFEVLEVERCIDPGDAVNKVDFNFIGIKEKKLIKDCTYEEFEEVYGYYIKGIYNR